MEVYTPRPRTARPQQRPRGVGNDVEGFGSPGRHKRLMPLVGDAVQRLQEGCDQHLRRGEAPDMPTRHASSHQDAEDGVSGQVTCLVPPLPRHRSPGRRGGCEDRARPSDGRPPRTETPSEHTADLLDTGSGRAHRLVGAHGDRDRVAFRTTWRYSLRPTSRVTASRGDGRTFVGSDFRLVRPERGT